jgi:hypothetical protein
VQLEEKQSSPNQSSADLTQVVKNPNKNDTIRGSAGGICLENLGDVTYGLVA